MSGAASVSEVTDVLDLHKITGFQWYVQACCTTSGEGLVDGMEWLVQRVKEAKKREGNSGAF